MITKEEREELRNLWIHGVTAPFDAYLDSLTLPEGQVQVVLTEGMAAELRNHLVSSPIQFGAVLKQLEPETPEQRMERSWKAMGWQEKGGVWHRRHLNSPEVDLLQPDFLHSAEAREEGLRWLAQQSCVQHVALVASDEGWMVDYESPTLSLDTPSYANPGEAIIDAILRVGEAQ